MTHADTWRYNQLFLPQTLGRQKRGGVPTGCLWLAAATGQDSWQDGLPLGYELQTQRPWRPLSPWSAPQQQHSVSLLEWCVTGVLQPQCLRQRTWSSLSCPEH